MHVKCPAGAFRSSCGRYFTNTSFLVQVSHNPLNRRGESSFLWPALLSSDGREEEEALRDLDVTPEESEDELGETMGGGGSSWRQSTFRKSELEDEATAETCLLDTDLDRLHNPHLAKSYMRLENAPFLHFKQQKAGTKDKWHEWFHMQKDWMNNVEENPENYFDDNL